MNPPMFCRSLVVLPRSIEDPLSMEDLLVSGLHSVVSCRSLVILPRSIEDPLSVEDYAVMLFPVVSVGFVVLFVFYFFFLLF